MPNETSILSESTVTYEEQQGKLTILHQEGETITGILAFPLSKSLTHKVTGVFIVNNNHLSIPNQDNLIWETSETSPSVVIATTHTKGRYEEGCFSGKGIRTTHYHNGTRKTQSGLFSLDQFVGGENASEITTVDNEGIKSTKACTGCFKEGNPVSGKHTQVIRKRNGEIKINFEGTFNGFASDGEIVFNEGTLTTIHPKQTIYQKGKFRNNLIGYDPNGITCYVSAHNTIWIVQWPNRQPHQLLLIELANNETVKSVIRKKVLNNTQEAALSLQTNPNFFLDNLETQLIQTITRDPSGAYIKVKPDPHASLKITEADRNLFELIENALLAFKLTQPFQPISREPVILVSSSSEALPLSAQAQPPTLPGNPSMSVAYKNFDAQLTIFKQEQEAYTGILTFTHPQSSEQPVNHPYVKIMGIFILRNNHITIPDQEELIWEESNTLIETEPHYKKTQVKGAYQNGRFTDARSYTSFIPHVTQTWEGLFDGSTFVGGQNAKITVVAEKEYFQVRSTQSGLFENGQLKEGVFTETSRRQCLFLKQPQDLALATEGKPLSFFKRHHGYSTYLLSGEDLFFHNEESKKLQSIPVSKPALEELKHELATHDSSMPLSDNQLNNIAAIIGHRPPQRLTTFSGTFKPSSDMEPIFNQGALKVEHCGEITTYTMGSFTNNSALTDSNSIHCVKNNGMTVIFQWPDRRAGQLIQFTLSSQKTLEAIEIVRTPTTTPMQPNDLDPNQDYPLIRKITRQEDGSFMSTIHLNQTTRSIRSEKTDCQLFHKIEKALIAFKLAYYPPIIEANKEKNQIFSHCLATLQIAVSESLRNIHQIESLAKNRQYVLQNETTSRGNIEQTSLNKIAALLKTAAENINIARRREHKLQKHNLKTLENIGREQLLMQERIFCLEALETLENTARKQILEEEENNAPLLSGEVRVPHANPPSLHGRSWFSASSSPTTEAPPIPPHPIGLCSDSTLPLDFSQFI